MLNPHIAVSRLRSAAAGTEFVVSFVELSALAFPPLCHLVVIFVAQRITAGGAERGVGEVFRAAHEAINLGSFRHQPESAGKAKFRGEIV